GVSVGVAPNPLADELFVTVELDEDKYLPAALPPRYNVNVPWDGPKGVLAGIHSDAKASFQALMGVSGILDPLVGLIYSKGFDTDRYQLDPPGGSHDLENVVFNAAVRGGVIDTKNSGYSVDDNQPYPIYGWMSLEWVPKLVKVIDDRVVTTTEIADLVAARR